MVDLTYNISDIAGTDFDYRRMKVWIETNIPDEVLIDAGANTTKLGDAKSTPNPDGTGIFLSLTATNAPINPTNFQYRVWVDYPRSSGKTREKWNSGWFSLTADADLADIVAETYVPPTYSSALMTELDTHAAALQTPMDTAVAQAEAARDAAVDISGISTSDGVVEALVKGTAGAGPLTRAALADTFVPRPASDTAGGIHFGTDPTVDPFITIGNRNDSGGWPGTGSPEGTPGALAVYQAFGTNDGANTPIPKSTQAIFIVAPYYGPTSEDSAEAGSSSVIMKGTGTPYTQTQQTIAFEGTATVESGVTTTGLVSGVTGRAFISGAASQVVSVRASAQTAAEASGTISTYYAFAQLATPAYGTIATKWGVYVVDKAHSETGLSVGDPSWTGQASIQRTGNTDSSVSLLVLKGPDSLAGDPSPRGLTNLSLVQGANQTRALFEARDSSGNTRFAIGATGAPRVAGVIMNFTDGGGAARIVMDHATGIELKESRNIIVGTTGGTKIATATTQKLGFWNATPVVQPSGTPAAATDLATALTLVNDLRTKLLTIGLVA